MAPNSRIPLNTPVSIDYLDSAGVLTHRTIYPLQRYMRHGAEYVRAFCSLRGEERTFRMDRIRSWSREKNDSGANTLPIPGSTRPLPGSAGPRNSNFSPQIQSLTRNPVSESVVIPAPAARNPESTVICVIIVFTLMLAFNAYKPKPHVILPKPVVIPAPAPVKPVVVQPRPEPAPAEEKTPEPVPAAPECDECGQRFRLATGISSPELESIYAAADYDRNGRLTWREIQIFQNWMKSRFVYRSNDRALSPDRFLAEGGGDCEDWALFTCGMLRYWGWETYLGTAGPRHRRRNSSGHAFTFIKTDEVPQGFDWFELTCPGWSFSAPTGKYVPVDYEVVGGYSNAVRRRWVIDGISSPESNYGKTM